MGQLQSDLSTSGFFRTFPPWTKSVWLFNFRGLSNNLPQNSQVDGKNRWHDFMCWSRRHFNTNFLSHSRQGNSVERCLCWLTLCAAKAAISWSKIKSLVFFQNFFKPFLYSQKRGRTHHRDSDLFRELGHDGQSDFFDRYCNHTNYTYTDRLCAPEASVYTSDHYSWRPYRNLCTSFCHLYACFLYDTSIFPTPLSTAGKRDTDRVHLFWSDHAFLWNECS